MRGRELESLIKQVANESGHPKIDRAEEFVTKDSDSRQLGVRVLFQDRSEVFCQFVQAVPASGRVSHPDYQIPEEMQ
jgi:hypothetical protein